MTEIRAYANCDHGYVVWRYDARIPGCRGFAIQRRAGEATEYLESWVGFAGGSAPAGTTKPTTEWPIQKFMWSDYDVPPDTGVTYRAVPMVGPAGSLEPDESQATAWTEAITASADVGNGMSAYFNRGVVASQWVSRRLAALGEPPAAGLEAAIKTPGDPIRDFLGGAIVPALTSLLEDAKTAGTAVYAALFELNDPELISLLCALGPAANVILTNGSSQPDENSAARAQLEAGHVTVSNRMVTGNHLAHNKFAVFCDASGVPAAVWTGSTNWTVTGLCTQANNALLVRDPTIAGWYRREWDAIKAAGNDYPDAFLTGNDTPLTTTIGTSGEHVWFAPVRNLVDLADAKSRIDAAKDGVLFLMFNPGPSGTLLNDIIDRTRSTSATYAANLYVHGVLNQDPSTTAHPIVGLFHRGQYSRADIDVVLPAAVTGPGAYWIAEMLKLPTAHAIVHSKTIVIDPFGETPVVMTGSHNMGPKASGENDDNLVIVEGAPALAAAYAVDIMAVYNQYRWRYRENQHAAAAAAAAVDGAPGMAGVASPAGGWAGLADDDTWQNGYFRGAKARELSFWLGDG